MALMNVRRCQCNNKSICHCLKDEKYGQIFNLNVEDTAATLVDVLILCRVLYSKAVPAAKVITDIFKNYDEERIRVDAPPKKKLRKAQLLHMLSTECRMDRFNMQLSYSIIKRVFRAFYFATNESGFPDRIQEFRFMHFRQCYWLHAAVRSAQIFAIIESLDHSAQKNMELKLICIYKRLFDRIESRVIELEKYILEKDPCKRRIAFESRRATSTTRRSTGAERKSTLVLTQCSCTKLECFCEPTLEGKPLHVDFKQGPYEVLWVPHDNDDLKVPQIDLPEDKVCTPSSSEKECISEEYCICEEICECVCEESELLTATEAAEEEQETVDECEALKDLIGEPTRWKESIIEEEELYERKIKRRSDRKDSVKSFSKESLKIVVEEPVIDVLEPPKEVKPPNEEKLKEVKEDKEGREDNEVGKVEKVKNVKDVNEVEEVKKVKEMKEDREEEEVTKVIKEGEPDKPLKEAPPEEPPTKTEETKVFDKNKEDVTKRISRDKIIDQREHEPPVDDFKNDVPTGTRKEINKKKDTLRKKRVGKTEGLPDKPHHDQPKESSDESSDKPPDRRHIVRHKKKANKVLPCCPICRPGIKSKTRLQRKTIIEEEQQPICSGDNDDFDKFPEHRKYIT